MLHAFHVDGLAGGNEAWAFIPYNLLGKLRGLMSPDYADCHEYFAAPKVADVFIDPDGAGAGRRQWRTLLIGGEREGGTAYFALDVTEPGWNQFKPLWEFSDLRMGESWSVPAVARIRLGDQDKWLGFVGNGFNNSDRRGYLLAIDLETGANLRDPLPVSLESPNVVASPRAVDINGDDYADSVFAGDLQGKVWRLDVTNQTGTPKTYEPLDPAEWVIQEMFETSSGQPVIQSVGLSFYCAGPADQQCQNLMIYFGTGKFLTVDDKTDDTLQSFYAIKDEFGGITREDMGMRNRTTADDCRVVEDPGDARGWYVDLLRPGERVSSPPPCAGWAGLFPHLCS
jgi:type IV pilus assembly protein PilY1